MSSVLRSVFWFFWLFPVSLATVFSVMCIFSSLGAFLLSLPLLLFIWEVVLLIIIGHVLWASFLSWFFGSLLYLLNFPATFPKILIISSMLLSNLSCLALMFMLV